MVNISIVFVEAALYCFPFEISHVRQCVVSLIVDGSISNCCFMCDDDVIPGDAKTVQLLICIWKSV